MKKAMKVMMLVLCAALLIAGSVLGTIAYLTSQAKVENTFTVGQIAITLDETNVDGKDAAGNDNSAVARDIANSYKLVPGATLVKDPVIHVAANSEPCYLFVKVENGLANIESNEETVAAQLAANGWQVLDADNYPGVYYYANVVETSASVQDYPVFQKVIIADELPVIDIQYRNAKVIVTAYAIQKAGFDSAAAAWQANVGAFNTGN